MLLLLVLCDVQTSFNARSPHDEVHQQDTRRPLDIFYAILPTGLSVDSSGVYKL